MRVVMSQNRIAMCTRWLWMWDSAPIEDGTNKTEGGVLKILTFWYSIPKS